MFYPNITHPELAEYIAGAATAIKAILDRADEIVGSKNLVKFGRGTVGKNHGTGEISIVFTTTDPSEAIPAPLPQDRRSFKHAKRFRDRSGKVLDDKNLPPQLSIHKYVITTADGAINVLNQNQVVSISLEGISVRRDAGGVRNTQFIKDSTDGQGRPGFEVTAQCRDLWNQRTFDVKLDSVFSKAIEFSKQLCTIMAKLEMPPEAIPQILTYDSWAEKLAKPVTTQRPQGR